MKNCCMASAGSIAGAMQADTFVGFSRMLRSEEFMIKRPAIEFDKDLFKRSVEYNVRTMYRRTMKEATEQQVFQASALALKDQIIDCWMRTQKAFDDQDPKSLVFLFFEFLTGREFGNHALHRLSYQPIEEALNELGF